MNTKIMGRMGRMGVMAIAALMAAMLVCLAPPKVEAQVQATTWNTFTNVPLVIPANTTTNILSAIDWRQGKSLVIMPYFARTNAGTDTIKFNMDVTYDGTNYTTVNPVTWLETCNGTTAVRGFKLIPPSTIDSVARIRLTSITWTNASDGVRVTNVAYSWRN